MTYNDLRKNIDIQVAVHLCWYNYDTEERVFGSYEELGDKEINYMYTEHDEIIIEVDMEN